MNVTRAALRAKVLADVMLERQSQDQRWGDQHDDEHNEREWLAIIWSYLRHAEHQPPDRTLYTRYRENLIKVAALCVAAVESIDRQAAKAAQQESPLNLRVEPASLRFNEQDQPTPASPDQHHFEGHDHADP